MHDLEKRIQELEHLQKQQLAELKACGSDIGASLSPARMLKSALKDVAQEPGLGNTVLNTAIGIGAGLLGKKIYVGRSKNIFKKIAGTAVEFLVANFVRKKIPAMRENNVQHNGQES